MTDLSAVLIAASTVRAIGIVIALLAVVAFIVYALFNIRAGRSEVGAEIELAPNKKPYYDDDTLETRRLDRVLQLGLGTLALVGIGLPAYWLAEPGRQEGAIKEYDRIFAARGERLYNTGANCAACHGPNGVGGTASYTILDEGEFVAQVNWQAPNLQTVMLRYSREEVEYILNYGRPYSPMPAWGGPGGGPLTEQQIKNLVDYLASITITSEESKANVEAELRETLGLAEGEAIDYGDLETGEALFNLGRESAFAGGAYACGRCHTRGWSIDAKPENVKPSTADLDPYVAFDDGDGAYGPAINSGIIPRQFRNATELADFLYTGAERGKPYGLNGLSGDGMMPGFGENPNTIDTADDGMLSREMVEAIAAYVDSLHDPSSGDEA